MVRAHRSWGRLDRTIEVAFDANNPSNYADGLPMHYRNPAKIGTQPTGRFAGRVRGVAKPARPPTRPVDFDTDAARA